MIARLNPGESIDQALIYFRCCPVLEAPDGLHDCLNRHIFVATGEHHPAWLLIGFIVVR